MDAPDIQAVPAVNGIGADGAEDLRTLGSRVISRPALLGDDKLSGVAVGLHGPGGSAEGDRRRGPGDSSRERGGRSNSETKE
jgi:hypothetical protein